MKKNFLNKNSFRLQFSVLSFLILISGCSTCNKKNYEVDVSNISVELKTHRFDKDLMSLTQLADSPPCEPMRTMKKEYGDFFSYYVHEILSFAEPDTSCDLADSLQAFLFNPYFKSVFDTTCFHVYDNVDDLNKQLTEGFKHYIYYFPNAHIPAVVYYLNGPRAFTYGDRLLAIGLDWYLGSDYWYYHAVQPAIPQFLIRRLRKEYIVPNAMSVMGTNLFPFIDDGKKCLDEMIYNGKILYLQQHILPQTPDSLITGFSQKDLEWMNDNEKEMWGYYLENKLLYETDALVYKKYVNDGPSTTGMPPEAPGNTGSWIGWRIIQKFMEENPDYTLQGLMNEQDAQKILTLSKYKP